ncbi:MAG: hotdog domain-containing protein [Niabella sp.]
MAKADSIEFRKPIPAASMVELIGRVYKTGNTSITVKVDVYVEKMQEEFREKAVSGLFMLVAIDEHHKPVKIAY